MPVNLTSPRPDIVYLRRRLKLGETVAAVPVVATRPSTFTLNGSSAAEASLVQVEIIPEASVPAAVGLTFMREINAAYRLKKVQSGAGSLIIGNAMVAGWQMQDGSSGYLYNAGVAPTESHETKPKEFKKRALVEFHKDLLVVGLRNIKHLKRLIVVPKTGETLQAETIGGTGVIMDYEPFTALYISVIDSVIEFRREDFRGTITETFNLHTVKPHNAPETTSLRTLFS